MTEVVHGQHASYLRPCGTSLTDAEDATSAFVQSVKGAAAHRARQEEKAAAAAVAGVAGLATGAAAPHSHKKGAAGARTGGVEKVGGVPVAKAAASCPPSVMP